MFEFLTDFVDSLTWRSIIIWVLAFLATFLFNLAIVTLILVKLPADHFSKEHRGQFWSGAHPAVRVAGIIGKNLAGLVLVALGIVLSIPGVPGQGLLTVLLGIMLLDFPGKAHLEQKLLSRPSVVKAINGLRHRFGKPPLEL